MLKLKLLHFSCLMQSANSLEKTLMLGKTEGKRRRGRQRTIWLDGIIHATDMNLSKLWEIAKDREAWRATVHGVKKSQTQLSDWTITEQEQHVPALGFLWDQCSYSVIFMCCLGQGQFWQSWRPQVRWGPCYLWDHRPPFSFLAWRKSLLFSCFLWKYYLSSAFENLNISKKFPSSIYIFLKHKRVNSGEALTRKRH